MSDFIAAKVDTRAIDLAFEELSRSAAMTDVFGALRDAGGSVRTEAVRIARGELTLRALDVRRGIAVSLQRSSASVDVKISGEAVPLSRYAARQTKKGVTVQVKQRGSRMLIPGVFLAKMASGHIGVFRRIGGRRGARRVSPSGRAYRPELPIRELFSTTLAQLLGDHAHHLKRHGLERFRIELHQRLLNRLRRKGNRA